MTDPKVAELLAPLAEEDDLAARRVQADREKIVSRMLEVSLAPEERMGRGARGWTALAAAAALVLISGGGLQLWKHSAGAAPSLEVTALRGNVTGILSNGDPAMLAVAVKSAGLEGLLDHVISVDGIRKYKTDPAAYALGPQATGLPARQIAFVSCNSWDALAATWYGYRTLWVNRYQLPFEELGTQPDYSGSTLRDVLSLPGLGAPA